jgi:hypothetical protein
VFLVSLGIHITESPSGLVIPVRVIPRARRTKIGGLRSGALLVRLAAPPVDGAANEALIAYLATRLQRPKRDLTIIAGETSREKRVAVAGMTRERLMAMLSDILRA